MKKNQQNLQKMVEKGRLPLHCACVSMVNHINEMSDMFKKGVKDGAKLKIQESNIANTLLKYDKAAAKICDDGGNLFIVSIFFKPVVVPDLSGGHCQDVAETFDGVR